MATTTDTAPIDTIDVLSNRVYSEGVPHDLLARLRREQPIYWQQIPDEKLYDEAWVLTRHADVLAVSRDTDNFINGHGLNLRGDYSDDEGRHLLNLDDPHHLKLRRLTNKGFTPKVVRRYEAHYRALAGRLIDDAIAASDDPGNPVFDAVDALSVPLPLMAICELLGTTPDDREQLVAWSNAIITNDDPDYSPTPESRNEANAGLEAYILDMLADRRKNPRDDLATVLTEHLDQGTLSPQEFNNYVMLLFVAGNETTRNNISHGLHQLAANPDQYELLKTGEHFDTAVDEVTRWASPVIYMSRTVVNDVEYEGLTFRKDQKVVLHYASANRDETVFDDPMTFNIRRDPNPHIAFGFGAHFCLGVHLAKLETKCILEELVARADRLELVSRPSHVHSSFIAGIKELPVRLVLK